MNARWSLTVTHLTDDPKNISYLIQIFVCLFKDLVQQYRFKYLNDTNILYVNTRVKKSSSL